MVSRPGVANPTAEYRIKAACIFNFMRFIKWPEQSFESDTAPFVVAVVGKDPFGAILEQTFKDKTVRGRGIRIERYGGAADIKPCHVLFVSPELGSSTQEALRVAKVHPALTIGELEDFTIQGGMIRFYIKEQKVQFEINNEAAKERGLEVSSKLLKIAGDRGGKPKD